jgi:hypothetical protein
MTDPQTQQRCASEGGGFGAMADTGYSRLEAPRGQRLCALSAALLILRGCAPASLAPARVEMRRVRPARGHVVYWPSASAREMGPDGGKERAMRIGRIATVGMVLVVALGVTGAKEGTEKPTPGLGAPQEADVAGVLVEPQSRQPVVVLQGKRDRRHVVMSIGHFEAERIAIGLQGVTPPRPLTHDLILTLLGDLKASLRRIVITDLKDNVYYAVIYLETTQGVLLTIDSRPSDAIALAVRAKVPILVEDRVFDKAERAAPKSGSPTPHF